MTKWSIEDNFTKLDKMLSFKQGWNGYDGLPFTSELIIRAKAILSRIGEEQQPGVFPTGRNSVLMEWDCADGHSLDVEVFESRISITYVANYINVQGRFAGQWKGCNDITIEELLQCVKKFCEEHNA